MTIHHRTATHADLERLRPLLDHEFIFGKGRKISIARRFPSTFCDANAVNIFIADENGKIVSALLSKCFDWLQAGKIWRGAMVGAVYTDPARRGQGIAGNLLKWSTQSLQDAGAEFAVLWSVKPTFYARLGWIAADIGMFGRCGVNSGAVEPSKSIVRMPLALCNESGIEAVRRQCLDARVFRNSLDYRQLPAPVESVDLLLWMDNGRASSYALLGVLSDTGILYEMIGNEDGFHYLWGAAQQRCRNIMINDCIGSPSYRWLAHNADIAWENKKLALWLSLSTGLDIGQMSQWYIPYFDRI